MTAVVVTLIVMGVISGIARTLYPATLAEHAEPVRARLWQAAGLHEPSPAARIRQVQEVEARFATNSRWIVMHAGVGALFLLSGSLQFVRRIRTRFIRFHRWNGRALLAIGLIVAGTGLYFGVVIPAAGAREAAVIGMAGTLFVVSLVNGALAIRKKDVQRHREWMIRAFAVAVGISVIRVVAIIADGTLTPRGWSLEDVFVLSLAVGWGITIAAAELWIAGERSDRAAMTQASS